MMEEKNKKFDLKGIALAVMLVLLIIAVFILYGMAEDIASLEGRLANSQMQINALRSEITSIYSNVDSQLKKQASLVSDVDCTFGEFNAETHTVPMTLKIVPKTLTDDTSLSVRIGDINADLVRDGNEFSATVPVGIFLSYGQCPVLSIKTGEETKTEVLREASADYLYYEYLPYVFADYYPSYEYSKGKLKLDGEICVTTEEGSAASFTEAFIVTERNGAEIERLDITDSLPCDSYEVLISKSYEIKDGDKLYVYLMAKDSLGYSHKVHVLSLTSKDGEIYEETMREKDAEIYDGSNRLMN